MPSPATTPGPGRPRKAARAYTPLPLPPPRPRGPALDAAELRRRRELARNLALSDSARAAAAQRDLEGGGTVPPADAVQADAEAMEYLYVSLLCGVGHQAVRRWLESPWHDRRAAALALREGGLL